MNRGRAGIQPSNSKQQRMESFTFDQRVAQITDQIYESEPTIAAATQRSSQPDVAEWQFGRFRAALTLHRAEVPPRLSLQLFNGEEQHPAPLQIGFYEADVVSMIAVPIAALLAGRGEG